MPRFQPGGNETFCRAANGRSRRDHAPAGPGSGPERVADERVIVKIPYRCLPRAGIEQEVIWITVVVKVRDTRNVPPGPSSGSKRGADAHVIVKIPYRRLPRIGIEQEVIWMTIEIKVRHARYAPPGPSSRPGRYADVNVVVHVPNHCVACR